MKKLFTSGLLITALLGTSATINAQTRETKTSYNKIEANSFVTDVMGDKAILEETMEAYFKQNVNAKSSSSKGFKLYKGVNWTAISPDKLDVYYKVNGKKGKNQVMMMVSKGYDNFVSTGSAPEIAAGVTQFMNSIPEQVAKRNNANEILAAEEALKEAQKAHEKALSADNDMRKEKEKLEKAIAEQEKAIADKDKAVKAAQAALETAKSKK